MTYILPRPYLSYSAYKLWKTSKEGYRKRYYLNEDPFKTVETMFGNKIGKIVEDEEHSDNEVLSQLINYPEKEYRIEAEHKGLNLLGYLDQFNPETLSILEMKTGHKSLKGKSPWDRIKVQKHEQLVFYSMLVELKFGKVDPVAILQWLETDFEIESRDVMGHKVEASTRNLILTGNIETFKRRIYKWEREKMKKEVLQVAEEITKDYNEYRTTTEIL